MSRFASSLYARIWSEQNLFAFLLLLALIPIWASGRFFITGDGPCHVYNARVLLDLWKGVHTGYYDPFYFVNPHFDPNWFSHIALAALQEIFRPEVAEKVFLSLYVLLFVGGFRFLVLQINPANLFLTALAFLFVWQRLLMQGFYNYVCSLALFFWVSAYWLYIARQIKSQKSVLRWAGHWLLWVLLLHILYSMHPIGLFAAGLFTGLAVLTALRVDGLRLGIRQALAALLGGLPVAWQVYRYILRKEWNLQDSPISPWRALEEWIQIDSLTLFGPAERFLMSCVSGLLLLWVLVLLWRRIRAGWQWRRGDFLLLFVGVMLVQYYRQSHQSYELLMTHRLQPISWLGILLWLATGQYADALFRKSIMAVCAASLLFLLWLRVPVHRDAAAYVTDCMSSLPHIRDSSNILVLNYDFSGHTPDGRSITEGIWLFNHAADYMGAYRVAIMSDNYEATRHYFPLIWHWERDMFGQTDKDGINFDHRPPRADIEHFNARTGGHNLNYVLIWGRKDADLEHPYSKEIVTQLAKEYDLIHTSPTGAALLYRKR